MKNKKLLAGIILAFIVVAAGVITLVVNNRTSSFFDVENNEDGSISVTAQKAGKDSSGMGYITLEESQKLKVRANLTDSSSICIEVLPANVDATTKVLMEETFTAIDVRDFELPAGEYAVRITAQKGATGSIDIKAE